MRSGSSSTVRFSVYVEKISLFEKNTDETIRIAGYKVVDGDVPRTISRVAFRSSRRILEV